MNYYNKYSKYKIKYLNLKYNNQYGGAPEEILMKVPEEILTELKKLKELYEAKIKEESQKSLDSPVVKNNIIKRLKQQCNLLSYEHIPSSFQDFTHNKDYTTIKKTYTELRDNTIIEIMNATEYKNILNILKAYTGKITELINKIDDFFGQTDVKYNMNKYITYILGECKTFIDDTIREAETVEKLKNKKLPPYPDSFKSLEFKKSPKICIPNINGTFSTPKICNLNEDSYLQKLPY
jgi:hypothetical protein